MKKSGFETYLHIHGTSRNGKKSVWVGEHMRTDESSEPSMYETFRNEGTGHGGNCRFLKTGFDSVICEGTELLLFLYTTVT